MTDNLSIVYFPAAVLLGALHALEPGHAKALTASYLIGIKGTKKDSLVLGLSAATTHSIVVILISAIGLWIGNEAFTGDATRWLERGSGFVAIAIGSWMLYRRLFVRRISQAEHHHDSEPVIINGSQLKGLIEIVATPIGERMRFTASPSIPLRTVQLKVEIQRAGETETILLDRSPEQSNIFLSEVAPDEPHEFRASIVCEGTESVAFEMHEPEHRHHDNEQSHAHLDDEAHARAHAATLPSYVSGGERPTTLQIMAFGAAGGMIPCPASITVMLLALSTGRAAMGLFTVLGFSLGLAIALVGVGMLVVTGLSKISDSGRLSWVTQRAPLISAVLVIASGCAALIVAR